MIQVQSETSWGDWGAEEYQEEGAGEWAEGQQEGQPEEAKGEQGGQQGEQGGQKGGQEGGEGGVPQGSAPKHGQGSLSQVRTSLPPSFRNNGNDNTQITCTFLRKGTIKNPGRQRISRPMRIVAPIPKKSC